MKAQTTPCSCALYSSKRTGIFDAAIFSPKISIISWELKFITSEINFIMSEIIWIISELNFVISQLIGGESLKTPIFREEAKRNIWSLRSKFLKIWFPSLLTILNNYNKNHKNPFFRLRLRLWCCFCSLLLVCKHTDKSLQPQHTSLCDSNLKKAKTSALTSLKNRECLPFRENLSVLQRKARGFCHLWRLSLGTKPYWVSNLVPESVLLGTRLEGQDEEPQASAVTSGVFLLFFSLTRITHIYRICLLFVSFVPFVFV